MIQVMEHATDIELVREYVEKGSEQAFATLVKRHVALVYSAVMRQVRDAHAAQEVTQATFIVLARKAHKFNDRTIVSAWLYRTARFAAADFLKMRARRIKHEQEAAQMDPETSDTSWAQVEPLLDDAVDKLGESDRNALLLRYFENKTLREVGSALGVSDDTAQKRITRAIDRLRKWFAHEGILLSIDALASWPAQVVQPAPDALANAIIHSTISNTTLSVTTTTLVKGTLQMMAWTKFKFAMGIATLLLLTAGTATMVAQKVSHSERTAAIEKQRSTPIGALHYLLDAFAAYDGEKIVDSHFTNSAPMVRIVLAVSAAVNGEGHLRKALEEKFQNTGGLRGPSIRMEFDHGQLDSAEEKITGDTATVTIPGRDDVQHLVRVGKVWKITVDSGTTIPNAEPRASRLEAVGQANEEIAQAVRQGRFQTSTEATAALQKKLAEVMKLHGPFPKP